MSVPTIQRRKTTGQIRAMKGSGQPVVSLTAYTTPVARLFDPHVDFLLVGDSVGMVFYGFKSSLEVTLDMMIAHGAAVMRGVEKSCVIVDMPFGTYQESPEQAFRNAARMMVETGCDGVKLEGGEEMAETIHFMTQRGIPVLGHIGLTPQSINAFGSYSSRGRTDAEAKAIMSGAQAIEEAGAFAYVIEATQEPLAKAITEASGVPTIGIGASVHCDGQVLVADDMLGLFSDFKPKFVKHYASLAPQIASAAETYAAEVRSRAFPAVEHTYQPKKS
ncbi:3-methyl-2-oxobutanoate hydroxymethyltransferase [Hartmannibacter diazotrophicus]|uniref:3-methyl-2-oxobutanoate hydroxymethyltransferase n=1 Tax=Hartmannibacter diazotrophicus TaxID=1482074 RepID=A0A2C9D436_9HYPH|nr:3-methyl-2-oxobutanoate hydroxymethyltransferase [Hartmannibacter diazotrophicus]SON54928.1 3-methyl-2-oxobutanoate hydroxymethyltransferase [Hartmannibacter diazotrophicus]